jgi:endonuclease YncB( thermonuclease family)
MKRLTVAAALAAALSFPAIAGARISIVDGDTLKIDGQTIRIVEIDTPESYRSRCENELVLALDAKQRLRELINAGEITFEPVGTDRYRRTLARVFSAGVNIGDRLLAEGHALRYQAGKNAKLERLRVWCGPDAELTDTWRRK